MQARQAIGRPLGAYRLPKPQSFSPRSLSQVGLGTGRNFHSSRLILQNQIDNVLIPFRAFAEVDWELKAEGRKPVKMAKQEETLKVKGAEKMPKRIERGVRRVSGPQTVQDCLAPTSTEAIFNLLPPREPSLAPCSSLIALIRPDVQKSGEECGAEVEQMEMTTGEGSSEVEKTEEIARPASEPQAGPTCLAPSPAEDVFDSPPSPSRRPAPTTLSCHAPPSILSQERGAGALSPVLVGTSTPFPEELALSPVTEKDCTLTDNTTPNRDIDPSSYLILPVVSLPDHEARTDSSLVPEHNHVPGSPTNTESGLTSYDSDDGSGGDLDRNLGFDSDGSDGGMEYESDGSLEYDRLSDRSELELTGIRWNVAYCMAVDDGDGPKEWMF